MILMAQTEKRKSDHLKICSECKVEAGKSGFGDVVLSGVEFIHNALPEINFEDIDTRTDFLGKHLEAPIMIAAMTGGTPEARSINRNLATAAQKLGIGMGIGSQRAAIENPELESTYQIREMAPGILLLGNLGIVQFVKGYGVAEAKKAIEMIKADGLALHLNALQEIVQPEGDTNWKGCLRKIKEIADGIEEPIVVKETGAGISKEVAVQIEKAGASAIDVGGLGGTSWALVEKFRNSEEKDKIVANDFGEWGIPTAVSLIECKESVRIPLIATGGVRNGIEIAKALSLGADLVGVALPLLRPAMKNEKEVEKELYKLIRELKICMFLTGANNMRELRKRPLVITGKTREWLEARGIDFKKFARRNQ